ncbi:MAG TPA: glycosyltransferase family 39 protein [Candidatus Nanoarchaeia archaeon]|nr:glycosyltransferase family 39 protein [Candidatus Nanoarchaeia archaeon]
MALNFRLLFLSLFVLIAMLLPFSYYNYQTSDDGWQHMQKAECYANNGGFPFKALYDPEVESCNSYPNYPPLFSLMLAAGFNIGDKEGLLFFARLLPSLLGALCVIAAYLLARTMLDEAKSLIAAALGALAPEFMILSSTNAQPQVLGILLSLLCYAFLARLYESKYETGAGYKKNFSITVICAVLLIYSYVTYAAFMFIAFGISVLWRRRYDFLIDMTKIVLVTSVLSIPILPKYMSFNAGSGFSISSLFALDYYAWLIPLRIGLPLLLLALFSRLDKDKIKLIFPLFGLFLFISFVQTIFPHPSIRNLAFLVFPLAILAADGWQRIITAIGDVIDIRMPFGLLTCLLILGSAAAGAFSVHYFIQRESITPAEFAAAEYIDAHPGKIATYNWGLFNYDAALQYNKRDFIDDPAEIIDREKIEYVLLYSKTPEIYGMSNQEAAKRLAGLCSTFFQRDNVWLMECGKEDAITNENNI